MAAWTDLQSRPCPLIRGHPSRVHRGGSLQAQAEQNMLTASPLGAALDSAWVRPIVQVGMQCSVWPKDGSTALPQSSAAAG